MLWRRSLARRRSCRKKDNFDTSVSNGNAVGLMRTTDKSEKKNRHCNNTWQLGQLGQLEQLEQLEQLGQLGQHML